MINGYSFGGISIFYFLGEKPWPALCFLEDIDQFLCWILFYTEIQRVLLIWVAWGFDCHRVRRRGHFGFIGLCTGNLVGLFV